MKVYSIKFGLNSAEQNQIIDKMKNAGYEVIQVSDGLLVKTDLDLTKLKSELEGLNVSELDLSDPNLSKDAKVFAQI